MKIKYLCAMEQLCFLNDFPVSGEEKFYQKIDSKIASDYNLYVGGTYVCIKNKKGLTLRFTSAEIKGRTVSDDQVEKWLKQIRHMHTNF
jgi:hypothetical protein